jgi:chlorobactene glucosyltransferase
MTILALVIALALIVICATAILNTLLFIRLHPAPALPAPDVKVSVLIPARNEAAVISETVLALLAQTYPHLELLILDDDSSDGTADLARAAAHDDSRLTILRGQPLPQGWMGKNWACHQLSQHASGEILVFTDADVCWSPDALTAALSRMQREQADLFAVWPTQVTETWGERLVVPLMALAIFGYLPLPLVHNTSWAPFAAANGQCLIFRRRAYQTIGGHQPVRGNIVEDVALARRIKAAGLRLRMADSAGLITCRMYRNWSAVRDGFGKNILAGHGNSLPFLAFSTLFHLSLFVLPLLWLFAGLHSTGWPEWPLALTALGIGVRMLTAAATRQRLQDALLMPLSALLMTRIAAQSVWWHVRFGGPRWKGRTIAPAKGIPNA